MGVHGFLLVFLGGGIGAAGRHGVNVLATKFLGTNFPIGTFAINVAGAFAMGVVVELFAAKTAMSPSVRLFLTTGILGGFTTFSTYALEIGLLYERGELMAALVYGLGSLVVGVAALFAGLSLVKWLTA